MMSPRHSGPTSPPLSVTGFAAASLAALWDGVDGARSTRDVHRVLFALAFLLTFVCHGPGAQEGGDEDGFENTSWTHARQALRAGENQMAGARFEEAEASLRQAVALAPSNSELKGEAERALYLELPGFAVQSLVSRGQLEDARLVLSRAISIAAGHPEYVQQLTTMESDLNKGNVLEAGIPVIAVDGRAVISAVNEFLQKHHERAGRYPATLSEINRLLPPGEPPLGEFFVSRYRTSGAGYQLELTNLTNRQQVLSIEHTGLLQ